MSTRASIVISKDGFDTAYVYHHCDGYPDGVGKWLQDFLLISRGEFKTPEEMAKGLNECDYAYKIKDYVSGDEEYIYEVDMDKEIVHCFDLEGDEFAGLDCIGGRDRVHKYVEEEQKVIFTHGYSEESMEKYFVDAVLSRICDIVETYNLWDKEYTATDIRKASELAILSLEKYNAG